MCLIDADGLMCMMLELQLFDGTCFDTARHGMITKGIQKSQRPWLRAVIRIQWEQCWLRLKSSEMWLTYRTMAV